MRSAEAGEPAATVGGTCLAARSRGFRTQDAELVSFGITQHRPAVTLIDIGRGYGPERDGLPYGFLVPTRPQVEVQPVLAGLLVRHGHEDEVQPAAEVQHHVTIRVHLDPAT